MDIEDDFEEVLREPALTKAAQRILAVASDEFYRHGIHAVGVDTIAAKSGITKRTLYDRFGSKDNLVTAYLQARHHRWWRHMEQRVNEVREVNEQDRSPVLAVVDSYLAHPELSERGCAFINAAAELPAEHPARRVILAHKRAVRQRLFELLREQSPEVSLPRDLADEIFLLLDGALAQRGIEGSDHYLEKARRIVAQRIGAVNS